MERFSKLKIDRLKKIIAPLLPEEEVKTLDTWSKDNILSRLNEMNLSDEQIEELLTSNQKFKSKENDNDKSEQQTTQTTLIVEQARGKSEIELKKKILQMKKEALETIVVTITPLDERDITTGKDCEIFSIENSFMSIGKIVPFNIPVELPKCLVQSIREIMIMKVVPLNDEQQRIQKRYSTVIRVPRYNVALHTPQG